MDLITDIQLLPADEEPITPDNWHRVTSSLRDGVPNASPLFPWYQLGKSAYQLSDEEKQNLITELDVLYGEDRPWYGFEKLEPATTPRKEGRYESVYLTYRRGVKRKR